MVSATAKIANSIVRDCGAIIPESPGKSLMELLTRPCIGSEAQATPDGGDFALDLTSGASSWPISVALVVRTARPVARRGGRRLMGHRCTQYYAQYPVSEPLEGLESETVSKGSFIRTLAASAMRARSNARSTRRI